MNGEAARSAIVEHAVKSLDGDGKDLRIALLTRDAVEKEIIQKIVDRFCAALRERLCKLDPDMEPLQKGFSAEIYSHIQWRSPHWPKGAAISVRPGTF